MLIWIQRIFLCLVKDSQTMTVRIVWPIRWVCWRIHRWFLFRTANSLEGHRSSRRACRQRKRTFFHCGCLWKWLILRFRTHHLPEKGKGLIIGIFSRIGLDCRRKNPKTYHIRLLMLGQSSMCRSRTKWCHFSQYLLRMLVCWAILVALVELAVDYRIPHCLHFRRRLCGLRWIWSKLWRFKREKSKIKQCHFDVKALIKSQVTYFSPADCFTSSTSAASYLIWKLSNCDGRCPANDDFSVSISSCRNSIKAFSPVFQSNKILNKTN